MVESKIALVIESSSVVQGGAVVELVEGNDVVSMGISQSQMSHKPASAVTVRRMSCDFEAQKYSHESSPACDHNILHIRKRLVFSATFQNRGFFPHSKVFEELVCSIGDSWEICDQLWHRGWRICELKTYWQTLRWFHFWWPY
jgi:hypothetical protein